jgi:hypothetical protein
LKEEEMSRAIIFRFSESARLRIMAEQGLGNEACADIKGDMGNIANREIKANMDRIHVKEMQVDFTPIPGIDGGAEGFPQICYAKEGMMTFIEIIIQNSSNFGGHDIQHSPVSESILTKESVTPALDKISKKDDAVDFENIFLDIPELMEFSLEPGLKDAIKSLEAGDRDFSLQALEGAFDVYKSLPPHHDMMDLKDLMYELRKKEKEKVKVKTKEKSL